MDLKIADLEIKIKEAGTNYDSIIKLLENYLDSIGIENDFAYNYILEKCEKINLKNSNFDVYEFCDGILSFAKYGFIPTKLFANKFYERPLGKPTQNEIKAFMLIESNKTDDFIKFIKSDENVRIEAKRGTDSMLMNAIKLQNLDIIKFLIDKKANLKVLDSY